MHDVGVEVLCRRGAGVKTATRPSSGSVARSRSEKSSPGSSTRSLISARYAFRPVRSCATRMRADVAIGGIAAPLPSKTTTSGSSDAASRAPSSTFDANGAPAMPPPARRQPIVGTPASAAVSRWSDAACRPARESATRSSTRRRRRDELGLRRAAAAHRDDDDAAVAREQSRDVARDGRLPDALAGADDGDRRQLERMERRRVEAEVGADVRKPEREEARGEREPQLRRQHRLVGEVDDDLRRRPAPRRSARRSRARRAASRCRRSGSRRRTRTAARASASRTTSG